MNEDRKLAVAGLAVLVVVGGALGVLALQDAMGGNAGEVTPTATPSGGGSGGGGGGDGSGGSERTTERPPFAMRIESVEPCGQTCRDVTATIVNNQERRATGVTVYTEIYAGDDTDGTMIWEGTEDVGTLDPGASETDTKRIELGFMDAAAVQGSDGRITILVTVETDRQTVNFVRHRDVT